MKGGRSELAAFLIGTVGVGLRRDNYPSPSCGFGKLKSVLLFATVFLAVGTYRCPSRHVLNQGLCCTVEA